MPRNSKGPATMNAPTSLAPVLAAIATRTDPNTLRKPVGKGVAGVLVLFGPPVIKPTPAALRNAFEDACDRAKPHTPDEATHVETTAKFLATLPDVVTPVAALGIAVRTAKEKDAEWVHNMTREKAARWTYCSAHVTSDAVSINGVRTCAEAAADGTLTIDAGVPSHIATMLRDEYDKARGVVETTRISALVAAYLAKAGGRAIGSAAYLMPETTSSTCGVLAGLTDLGGFAVSYAVADPAQIAALAAPVVRSIEDQIADVTKAAQEFMARAAEVAKPDSTARMQERTGETVRASILAARKAAALWQDRLQLVALDVGDTLLNVGDTLDALDKAADEADKAALDAVRKRREAAKANGKLAREIAALTSSTAKSAATEPEDVCGFTMGRTGEDMSATVTCALPHGHKGPHDDGEGFRVDDNGRVVPLPGQPVRRKAGGAK